MAIYQHFHSNALQNIPELGIFGLPVHLLPSGTPVNEDGLSWLQNIETRFRPGVDVMITILGEFCQFSAKKIAVKIKCFAKSSSS
jgi:hypothetical protein